MPHPEVKILYWLWCCDFSSFAYLHKKIVLLDARDFSGVVDVDGI